MFQYLNLFKYVKKISVSPEDALVLLHRFETDSPRPEDYEMNAAPPCRSEASGACAIGALGG